jgi:acyl-CoA thioester hydrolase
MQRQTPETRDAYRHFRVLATRWMDNDVYGHVNNVVYYSYFDTVVNGFLVERGLLDIERSPVIGLVVETGCHFFRPIAFPDTVHGGLRVAHVSRCSVRYDIGLFREDEERTAAQGHFVHVYVDRVTRRPAPIPARTREEFDRLMLPA